MPRHSFMKVKNVGLKKNLFAQDLFLQCVEYIAIIIILHSTSFQYMDKEMPFHKFKIRNIILF